MEVFVAGSVRARASPGGRGSAPERGDGPGRAFDLVAHLTRRGLAAEVVASRARVTGRRRGGIPGALDAARRRAERGIDAGLSPPRAALARGMVLGQDEAIAPAVRDDFRASGLSHVLAVSGQNVMLLAALALPLLAATGLPAGARIGATVRPGGRLRAAGGRRSVASAGGRDGDRVAGRPRGVAAGFALVRAAAGGVRDARREPARGGRSGLAALLRRGGRHPRAGLPAAPARSSWLPRAPAEGVAVTVAATLATAPLLAFHFGSVSLASLPANVVALPLVAPIMWLGMLRAALAQLGAVGEAAGSLAQPAGDLLGLALDPLLGALSRVALVFAELPGAQVAAPLPTAVSVGLAYAGLAALALAARALARRSEATRETTAARWRRLPRARRAAASLAAALALIVPATLLLRTPGPPGELTVSFLDVGQGDATLIQHPDGTAVLFDGGPPEGRVVRLLRRGGRSAPHGPRDDPRLPRPPRRAAPRWSTVSRSTSWSTAATARADRDFRAVVAAAQRRGARRVPGIAPMTLRVGGLRHPHPRPAATGARARRPRIRTPGGGGRGQRRAASTSSSPGDAESPSLVSLPLPDVEAMKVSHHGSADPGLPAVLDRLRPEVAAIEVGEENTYGHPAPSTLTALRRAHAEVARTDRDGTVRLTVADGERRRRSAPGSDGDRLDLPATRRLRVLAAVLRGDRHRGDHGSEPRRTRRRRGTRPGSPA